MRLFIAIDLTDEMRKKIIEIKKKLTSGEFDVKFVEPENLHITLKFLGDVEEDKIGYIYSVLENVSKKFKGFNVEIKGLGYFGSSKFIRVIWLGIEKGCSEIVSISEQLEKELGFLRKNEFKTHSPHITIGRVKSGRNKDKLLRCIEELKDVNLGEMNVNVIKLKESILTKKGPIYSDLKSFKLS